MNNVWTPLPGSQSFALDARVDELLLYGTRGGAKTATQLMVFRSRVGLGYGQFWRGIILDLEYKSLSDVIAQSHKFFEGYNDGAKYLSGTSSLTWTWPTGEKLIFGYAKNVDDYKKRHGQEFPFIGYNELSKHPNGDLYQMFESLNRHSFVPEKHTPKDSFGVYLTPDKKPLPEMPKIILSTTNPSDIGRNWVKKKFIDCCPVGQVHKTVGKAFNPRTKKEEKVVRKQLALFCSFRENQYLDPKYVAWLESIKDPALRSAWYYGSWDYSSGGAFDDLWKKEVHVIPKSKIPDNWYVDRAFDWGSTHPFSVGWFAEANGEEMILSDGRKFCPPKGSIIQIDELYGSDEIGTNKGNQMSPTSIANEISDNEAYMLKNGWVSMKPSPGPADGQIANKMQSDMPTIESQMKSAGISWKIANKNRGTRTIGFALFREMLESSLSGEGEGFYVMDNCVSTIELLPGLPRCPKLLDDVNTKAEDHVWDMIRYRVLASRYKLARYLPVTFSF